MIVILIPALNEAQALTALLPHLPERLHGRAVRTIVIDDGSTDTTTAVARAHGADVLELPSNNGKSAALRFGLSAIASWPFECVVLMDGDGQHAPRDLEAVTGPVLSGEMEIVNGSRHLGRRGRGRAPLNRYLVRRVVSALLRARLGTSVTDPFCGYRCLSRGVATAWRPRGDRYEAELELLFDASRNGWALREVAVARIYTAQCSKMGATRGPFFGRLQVLRQYATTLARKSSELATTTSDRALPRPPGGA